MKTPPKRDGYVRQSLGKPLGGLFDGKRERESKGLGCLPPEEARGRGSELKPG